MREIRSAAVALVALSLVFGLAYPLAMTGIGQTVFGGPADGSIVKRDGKAVGSKLIGQDFSGDARATSRAGRPPRATAPAPRSSTTSAPTRRTSPSSCKASVKSYLARERPYDAALRAATSPPTR